VNTNRVATNQGGGFIRQDGTLTSFSLRGVYNNRDLDLDPAQGQYLALTLEPGFTNIRSAEQQFIDSGVVKLGNRASCARPSTTASTTAARAAHAADDRRQVFAIRAYYGAISGTVPFFEQFFIGGAETLRGYPEDRFWGKNAALLSFEFRQPIEKAFTAVFFVDIGHAWGGYPQRERLPAARPLSPRSRLTDARMRADRARTSVWRRGLRASIHESTYVKTNRERLQALEARYGSVLQTLQENIVLTNEERQELTNLLLTENPNDEQRKRIDQLTQTARQRASELQQLRQKPQLSETEKAALEQFTQMEAVGREAIQSLFQQLRQQLEQQAQQIGKQVDTAVRETIAQVAKEKKLSLVFSAGAVLYAENDITDDVIKRLNERK
jgi:Skp family chaperone for outer membrane proteins